MIDRLPPQSLEAEQSVLGAILIDRDVVVEVAEFLRPEDFYRQANGVDLHGDARAVRAARAGGYRHGRGGAGAQRPARGDRRPPISPASATRRPPPSTPTQYARIVERKAVLRNLISAAGQDRRDRLRGPRGGPGGDRPRRGGAVRRQQASRRGPASRSSDLLLHAAYDRLDYLHAHRGEINGVLGVHRTSTR